MQKYVAALALSLCFLPMPQVLSITLEETILNSCNELHELLKTSSFEDGSEQLIALQKILAQLEKINQNLEHTNKLEQMDTTMYRVLLEQKDSTINQLRLIDALNNVDQPEETPLWLSVLKVVGMAAIIVGIPTAIVLACYDTRKDSIEKPSVDRFKRNLNRFLSSAGIIEKKPEPFLDVNANIKVGKFW